MSLEEKYNVFSFFNILEGDEFGERYIKLMDEVFTDKTNEERLKGILRVST